MTATNMPGFTAEASLYATSKYHSAVPIDATAKGHVVPQIPIGLCTKAAYYCARGYEKWCAIYDRNCETDF
jgi:hypothetical protein